MKVPATTPARGAAARLRLQLVISPGPGRFIFTVVLERSRHSGSALHLYYPSHYPLLNTVYAPVRLGLGVGRWGMGGAVPEWRLSWRAPARAHHTAHRTRTAECEGGGARAVHTRAGPRASAIEGPIPIRACIARRATVYRVENNQVQTQQRLPGNPGHRPCHSAARHTRTVSQV